MLDILAIALALTLLVIFVRPFVLWFVADRREQRETAKREREELNAIAIARWEADVRRRAARDCGNPRCCFPGV